MTPEKQEEARFASDQLSNVIGRVADKDNVLFLLKQYGLVTVTRGKKSAAELLETAYSAFERPVTYENPTITSLIPMRECINGTIVELLRRRLKQEPVKSQGDKIFSIIRQLARNSVPESAAENLAHRWECLVDELSSSKQTDCSRDQWADCLRRSTLLLLELLQSLDPSKVIQRH